MSRDDRAGSSNGLSAHRRRCGHRCAAGCRRRLPESRRGGVAARVAATSRRPKCASRRRSADASSRCTWRRAIASPPATLIARLDTADAELAMRRAAGRARPGRWRSCGCCRPAPAPRTSARPSAQARFRRGRRAGGRRPSCGPPRPTSSGSRRCCGQRRLAQAARRCGDAAGRGGGAGGRGARAGARRRRRPWRGCRPASRPQEIAARPRPGRGASTRRSRRCRRTRADAVLTSPVAGIVTAKLVDAGEIDRAADAGRRRHRSRSRRGRTSTSTSRWCPRLRLGQKVDARHRRRPAARRDDHLHLAASAEFTPRNVQTAEERSRLVYRDQGDRRQP